MRVKKLSGSASEVRHPSFPEGDEEVPLLKEATDSGATRIWVGANHRLDKNEVRAMIKLLERWLETGSLKAPKGGEES
jgi:hypothetical protein